MSSANLRRKKLAAQRLAAGDTQAGAAKAANVTDRTIRAWLADPDFQALVQAEHDELFSMLSRRFVSATARALQVATAVIDDPKASVSQRLRAAELVCRHALAYHDQFVLAERIGKLEERLANVSK